jgi:hypothetical protein
MSLEELTEKATIEFRRPLGLKEAEDMLKQVSVQMKASINYAAQHQRTVTAGEVDEGSVQLGGMLSVLGKGLAEPFRLEAQYVDEECKFLRLQFQLIPGYDELSEYRPETIKIWDETREAVNKYFS